MAGKHREKKKLGNAEKKKPCVAEFDLINKSVVTFPLQSIFESMLTSKMVDSFCFENERKQRMSLNAEHDIAEVVVLAFLDDGMAAADARDIPPEEAITTASSESRISVNAMDNRISTKIPDDEINFHRDKALKVGQDPRRGITKLDTS